MQALPFRSAVDAYERQARELLAGWRAGDPAAVAIFRHKHPRFLSDTIPWLPKPISDEQIRSTPLDEFDARLALARWYDFQDWRWLRSWVDAVRDESSPVSRFEAAVEAVVGGDEAALAAQIAADPDLVRARSRRVTPFDPPVHGATLLHYVAANGVEGYRQRSPSNAVAIAKRLLASGADADALADMYGGRHATLTMLVSSTPPATAGVQVALVDALVDGGASVDPIGDGPWSSPVVTALAFGFREAAEALVRRGARIDTLAAAAGLGQLDRCRSLLASAAAEDRHRALALAAQLGHAPVVRLLLDAGEDPSRYNPPALHAHATPLHHASAAGHLDVVRLLVDRGARTDIRDRIWNATPLGWAIHGAQAPVAEYLKQRGAP